MSPIPDPGPVAGQPVEIAAFAAEPPSRIELMPVGRVSFADGRKPVTVADPAALVARSLEAAGGRLLIDFDHGADRDGGSTRAAGWIAGLDVEGERIVAAVEWTPEGAEALRARAYRYISPVYLPDAKRRVVRILRAGLTNTPALPQLREVATSEETTMEPHLKEIAAALGLPADAEVAAIVEAAKAKAKPAEPDPAKFVPVAAVQALTAELASVRAEVAKDCAARAIAAARAAGKLAPALDGWAAEYAAKDPAGFAAWVEAQPAIVAPGAAVAGKPGADASKLTRLEAEICAATGVSEEKFLATRRALDTKEAAR